jgi:hypothetical protein
LLLESSKRTSAHTFFELVLPRLLHLRGQGLSGTVAVELRGASRHRWLIDLGAETVEASEADAALCLSFTEEDFDTLLGGKLSVLDAHREGRIRLRGDRSLLTTLAPLFGESSP